MSRKSAKVHYASVEHGNESNPHDEWSQTACGLELEDKNHLTDNEKWVSCKHCLRIINATAYSNNKQ